MSVVTAVSRLRPLCPKCEPYSTWQCCDGPYQREYVYFAHIGDYVKVGRSTQPDVRVDQLRGRSWAGPVATPRFKPHELACYFPAREPLHSLHVVEVVDGHDGERDAHRALEEFGDTGEWFIAEPALLAWVAEQKAGQPFAPLPREGGAWERPMNDLERAEDEHLRHALDGLFGDLSIPQQRTP